MRDAELVGLIRAGAYDDDGGGRQPETRTEYRARADERLALMDALIDAWSDSGHFGLITREDVDAELHEIMRLQQAAANRAFALSRMSLIRMRQSPQHNRGGTR